MVLPIRRLEGISYWVIEDSGGIYDFVNTELRREWEKDVRSEGRDPKDDEWLKTLAKREWKLEIVRLDQIRLNPGIMNFVDEAKHYSFQSSLKEREKELSEVMRRFGVVIWPLVVKAEDNELVDGYCRYATLKAMKISKTYVYTGRMR
jgi:hypothetical protein